MPTDDQKKLIIFAGNESQAFIVKALEKENGYDVRAFTDGNSALDEVQNLSPEDQKRALFVASPNADSINGAGLIEQVRNLEHPIPTALTGGENTELPNRIEALVRNEILEPASAAGSLAGLADAPTVKEPQKATPHSREEKPIVAYQVGEPERIRKNDALFSSGEANFTEKKGFSSHHLFADKESVGRGGLDEDQLIEELKKQPNPAKVSSGDDAVLFVFHDNHLHKDEINKGDTRRVDGIDFIKKLKENNIHIPTVLVTKKVWGAKVENAMEELTKEGFIHYHATDPGEGPYYKAYSDYGNMREAAHAAIDRFHEKLAEEAPEPTTQEPQFEKFKNNQHKSPLI